MEKLIIGFSRPNKFKIFAWLIMKIWKTPFDHVYVKFRSDYYDRDIIYQASGIMVNFMSPVIFAENNLIIDEFELDITSENKIKLMQFAIDNAGKPYGLKEGIGLVLIEIARHFGKIIKNPFGDGSKTYVCSKLAAYIKENFTYSNKLINLPVDIDQISPLDMYNSLKAS